MLELNPMTAAEVEQAALAREHASFGSPQYVTRFPQALRRVQLKKQICTRLQNMFLIEAGVNDALRR